MSAQGTPRGNNRVPWTLWLTVALLMAWVVLGFIGGWELFHILGTAAMAALLLGLLRQIRHVRRKRSPGDQLEGADEPIV
ncbi:hypothetical protein ACH9EU_08460 [Kocuria sp. M1R5S2]|uniref:hypothetical protein n=1 Tax=Kocuria rhizosphaerae TaxID=3376285 RepID=UPI0037B7810C